MIFITIEDSNTFNAKKTTTGWKKSDESFKNSVDKASKAEASGMKSWL